MHVVLITLASTLCFQCGYFIWKQTADSLPQVGKAPLITIVAGFIGNWKWMSGLVATVLGWLLFIKATDLGEVSVVQPLMSVGDVFLVFLAVVFLHERLSRGEWIGLAITVAGATMLAFEARVTPPSGINWLMMAIFVSAVIALGAYLLARSWHSKRAELPLAIAAGMGFGMGAVLTKLMTTYITLNGLQLESSAFLLNPILPFMVIANVAGLVMLQIAFQRGRAAVIVPVQLSVVNGIVVVSGYLVFSETIAFSRLFAIALIIVGTACLHIAAPNQHGKNNSDGVPHT